MTKKAPLIEIVAGPNGSGKSTFAEAYLVRLKKRSNYLNPDLIASAVTPGQNGIGQFKSGRILLEQLKLSISKGEDVAFESTLSGRTYLNILRQAQQQGYQIKIYFVFLRDKKMNLLRIKQRVRMGGHDIPTKDVIRRYKRSFFNFWTHYRLFCKDWILFSNTSEQPQERINLKEFKALSSEQQDKFAQSFLKGKVTYEKK